MQAVEEGGSPFGSQAGGHPSGLLTSFDLNTSSALGSGKYSAPSLARDVVVTLPLGLIGNPQVIPTCPIFKLYGETGQTRCPVASRVGQILLEKEPGEWTDSGGGEISYIYNIQPEAGYPAEFGFTYQGKAVLLYANLARVGGRYVLRVAAPGIPNVSTLGSSVLFYGDPAQRDGTSGAPFFTNPTACSGEPLLASITADSWREPGVYTAPLSATVFPQIVGCDMLTFEPSLQLRPDSTQADEPSGFTFGMSVPQSDVFSAPATPELKNATVTLPAGVSINPAAAGGLAVCQETGPEGINIEGPEATEVGDGGVPGSPYVNSPYHDGQEHLSPGHCPLASTIGTVEVTSPVLGSPLTGHLYVAAPKCGGSGQPACDAADATNGRLFGVYLEASGSGAIVKLHGTVAADPADGRLTASFSENPQLPFSALTLHFKGGPGAPLANPQGCGLATTTSDLQPWSTPVTPDATPFSSFAVDWDGSGGGCPTTFPLAPGFQAGTTVPQAGGFAPFTLTVSRADREQDLSQLQVRMPTGLAGMLSSVPLCPEPQASQGACGAGSLIGSAAASAGAGPDPYTVQGGRVYLTGPYRGAPFGLSIVVPAVAGPFNLGDVVVRAAVSVDPSTAQVTVTSDPLPQIIDGIPLRLRTVTTTIDRPGFIFNPTSCSPKAITATVTGAQGATASVSSPFTAANCSRLAFKPSFTVSTAAVPSKPTGASLDARVRFPSLAQGSQANVAYVKVELPRQLPSRLSTLQKACLAATFEADPAACPAASVVGVVKASTPVLPVGLTGPVYLVSHGGEAFPDLEVVLQGDGVRVDLIAHTRIHNGVTSSTFAMVPDVPVSSFELYLPKGRYSALGANLPASANGSFCSQKLIMPTEFIAQNGEVWKQRTQLHITGCPKPKHATRHGQAARRATGTNHHGKR